MIFVNLQFNKKVVFFFLILLIKIYINTENESIIYINF